MGQKIPPEEFELMWLEAMAEDSTDFDFACFLQFMLALQLRDKGVTTHLMAGLGNANDSFSPGVSSDSGTNLPIFSSTNKLKEAAKYAVAEGKESKEEASNREEPSPSRLDTAEAEAKMQAEQWSSSRSSKIAPSIPT